MPSRAWLTDDINFDRSSAAVGRTSGWSGPSVAETKTVYFGGGFFVAALANALLIGGGLEASSRCEDAAGTLPFLERPRPVSYTHLDVYKRQIQSVASYQYSYYF